MTLTREPVEIENRRAMTTARKARIHTLRDGKCWMCGFAVEVSGPTVIYDHRVPLELGGTDDNSNLWPLHRSPCDRIKTAADRKRIDKAKRLQRKLERPLPCGSIAAHVNPWPPGRKMQSRPFPGGRKERV